MSEPGILGRLIKHDPVRETGAKWGLVLSGGGTKGAYEIGAWRAIRELRIPIRGIAGTSIGALNAAMLLGCDLKHIEKIYHTINLGDVLPLSQTIDDSKNVFDPSNLLTITKEYLYHRGLTNAPLRKMLEIHLDIDKIYASPLDLGIVTFDVRTKVAFEIFKEDIEKEKLIDYLLASANFPIYKTQNVDGKRFMDGGLYDNMPFNLLIGRGYTHLVVIDINGLGFTRKVEKADSVYLKMIQCSEDLGGTFEFNRERIDHNIKLGYLDTLKAFHKLFGNYFFFRRPAFNDLLLHFDLDTINGLENAARQFNMDRYRIYQADEFIDELEWRFDEVRDQNSRTPWKGIRWMDLFELRKLSHPGALIAALVNIYTEQPSARRSNLIKSFPEASVAALALIELKNYRKLQTPKK